MLEADFVQVSADQVISRCILGFSMPTILFLLQYDGWVSWPLFSDLWHYWILPLFIEF